MTEKEKFILNNSCEYSIKAMAEILKITPKEVEQIYDRLFYLDMHKRGRIKDWREL